jgi:hypothetical protein
LGDDPVNQLAVSVLTDQNVRFRASIGEGHHQLSSVPERNDDPAPLSIEGIDMLPALDGDPQHASEQSDHRCADRRHHDELQCVQHGSKSNCVNE